MIPLTLGAALAWASDAAHAGLFLLTLLGGVAVQTGTNMLNTYGDYRSGVDTEASAHGESPILLGLISPEAMRRGGLIALCVALPWASCSGFACGWPILAFGLVGIAGGYGYTSGFWPYKYHACGPIMVFLLMGPLMALPAYYIQGGSLDWRPFLASLPIACLVTSIMHANDIRDIAHDREAGITTLAMLLGRRKAPVPVRGPVRRRVRRPAASRRIRRLPLSGLLPFVLAPGLWRTLRTLRDPASARIRTRIAGRRIREAPFPVRAAAHCRNTAAAGLELAQGLIRGDIRMTPRIPTAGQVCGTLALAAFFWWVNFGLHWVNFWIGMGTAASVLALLVLFAGVPMKRTEWTGRAVLIGLVSAALLYAIFALGNTLSGWLFRFAPHQVSAIYDIRHEGSPLAMALVLLFITSPAEEVFWRGFIQRWFTHRFGGKAGWLLAVCVYAGVHVFQGTSCWS